MNQAFTASWRAFSMRRSAPDRKLDRADTARLIEWLARHVEIGDAHRRAMMRNGGGDAIDAVVAALGGALAWKFADHRRIARHPRYSRKGKLYV